MDPPPPWDHALWSDFWIMSLCRLQMTAFLFSTFPTPHISSRKLSLCMWYMMIRPCHLPDVGGGGACAVGYPFSPVVGVWFWQGTCFELVWSRWGILMGLYGFCMVEVLSGMWLLLDHILVVNRVPLLQIGRVLGKGMSRRYMNWQIFLCHRWDQSGILCGGLGQGHSTWWCIHFV